MANPFQKITPDPLWLNADGIPDGLSARRPIGAGRAGAVGVVRRSDYAVSFNAGYGITITGGEALVKGGDVTNQGQYYCYSNASKNITVNPAPAGAGTERVDQVILRVFDGAHDGSGLSEGRIEVVDGIPQATGDLNQNRDAAATNLATLASPPSKSYILLADILVANGAATLSSSVIRDRRQYCTEGGVSPLIPGNDTYAELATPRPHPSVPMRFMALDPQTYNGGQSAALVFLDRPISANKLVFTYRVDASDSPGPTANYMAAICDASGRVIFNQNAKPLTTAVGRYFDVMTMPLTYFDAGYYWYVFGMGAPVTNGTHHIFYYGMTGDTNSATGNSAAAISTPNVYLSSTTGGATFPATKTILAYLDANVSGQPTPAVPMFMLAR